MLPFVRCLKPTGGSFFPSSRESRIGPCSPCRAPRLYLRCAGGSRISPSSLPPSAPSSFPAWKRFLRIRRENRRTLTNVVGNSQSRKKEKAKSPQGGERKKRKHATTEEGRP